MEEKMRRYFDWAATAIPLPVPAAFRPEALPFGNPSSRHKEGRDARQALEKARSRCAAVMGVKAENLFFTSGGSESNAIIILSQLIRLRASLKEGNAVVISSQAEHSSVGGNIAVLESFGIKAQWAGLETDGSLNPAVFASVLSNCQKKGKSPRLAAIMAVNNETGLVNDIGALANVAKAIKGPPCWFHSDCVQALGKVPLENILQSCDSAGFSAHKIGGPRGIGLLYIKKPEALNKVLVQGGGQEHGFRPGTENTLGALAMAHCMESLAKPETVRAESAKAGERMRVLIEELKNIPRCSLLPRDRKPLDQRFSPWILQTAFKGLPGEVMVRCLDDAGFAVSTGSACSSANAARPVLEAMGIDRETAYEGIRISQGWTTTMEDIQALAAAIKDILSKI